MKKFLTLFWGLIAALSIQAQSDFPIQFADKDGNIIEGGTTLEIKDYETDAFGTTQMPTNLYVKNITNESIQIGGVYTIKMLDNGFFQTCFPDNCVAKAETGTFETSSGALGAGELKNMQTEWLPIAHGKCVVDYQLVTYRQNALTNDWSIDQYGPTITISFSYNTTDNTGDQMWWGYYAGEDVGGLGTGNAETFNCAIFIPENHKFVGASSIKALRIYVTTASNVSMMKVWISKVLPSSPGAANYMQSVDVASLSNGFNDIELTTPFEVNNQAIYVGYTFTTKNVEYCIPFGGEYVENSMYVSTASIEWDEVAGWGALVMQLLLEGGTYPNNLATAENFGPVVVGLGQTVDVPVKITNGGKDPITSISYTISSNGTTTEEKTIDIDAIPYAATAKVKIPFEADATEGTVTKTLTITKVNGNNNTATNNTAIGNMTTVADLITWPRNVLIEEFTTEECVYCPDAAAGLHEFMITYPDLANRTAVVCHHAGYYTDWLTIDADKEYTWFYDDGTYAPAFMYDRFAWDGKTPVVSRGEYKEYVEARLDEPSYVGIDMKTAFDGDDLNISINCQRGWDFCNTPARITVFLTEDNIGAISQTGANGNFAHQHVLRAVNEIWGSVLDWYDNYASYTYTFKINPSWKTEDLKVVAFVSSYDSNDPTNCVVENVTSVVAGETSVSSTSIKAQGPDHQVAKTVYYDLTGRQVTNPSNGLFIKSVTYQNGKTTTSKVILK